MPSSPKEFREFAEECLRRADETKSERHRKALLSLATTLVQSALQLERSSLALIADGSMLPGKPKPRPAR
jgi:hypothetical protein